jgi:hypothetical protein
MKTQFNFLQNGRRNIGLVLFFLSATPAIFAQNIAINTTGAPASASAILDLTNSASMALLVPPVVLTNAAVLAPVPGPGPAGLMVYNSSNSVANGLNGAGYYYWNGSAWLSIGSIAASTVMGAIDGTSLSGTNVILGNAFGSTLGQLTQNTEIPLNGNNLTFSNVGGAGNIGIDLPASTSAAQALEIGGTTNTVRIDGLGTGNSFNTASAATTNYLLYSNASGDIYSIPSASTNGYVLTYSTTNGPTWQAASGGVTAANNGLSLSSTTVQMGGPLIQNTSVGLAGYILAFDAGTFNINNSTGGTTNIGTGGSGATNIGNATGGTFFPAMSTANGVYYSSNASGLLAQTGASTAANQVLTTTTSGGAPSWQTPTYHIEIPVWQSFTAATITSTASYYAQDILYNFNTTTPASITQGTASEVANYVSQGSGTINQVSGWVQQWSTVQATTVTLYLYKYTPTSGSTYTSALAGTLVGNVTVTMSNASLGTYSFTVPGNSTSIAAGDVLILYLKVGTTGKVYALTGSIDIIANVQ